jgi:hypothetical protein
MRSSASCWALWGSLDSPAAGLPPAPGGALDPLVLHAAGAAAFGALGPKGSKASGLPCFRLAWGGSEGPRCAGATESDVEVVSPEITGAAEGKALRG